MPEIKTRNVIKGTVKTIDKSAVAAERMKEAYVRTKDKAEQSVSFSHGSPEEYASDRVSSTSKALAYETVHQMDKQGRCVYRVTKKKLNKASNTIEQRKSEMPRKMAREKLTEQTKQRASENIRSSVQNAQQERKAFQSVSNRPNSVRTLERNAKTIKQTAKSTGEQAVKVSKRTVKSTGKSVKTTEHTARASVKTMEASAKMAQRTAQVAVQTAQRTAQAVKAAAKATAVAIKAAAKATATAVKAIITGMKALIAALIAGGWISVVVILIVVLFGCALAIFGGSGTSSYTPVSEEVEAYEPVIERYAGQYGIPEYVELIKAVMMQESGGRGLDPMQSSEGGFNTRYPREPNGITDPDYSIQCGVQELKAALVAAEVENPIDMERIKLALQGYNFGSGYISWAKRNYGGYSYANAVEFSEMQAESLGWDSYGDTQYVPHVLRYYPFGRAFTSGGNQVIVEVGLSQLGNVGGEPYWSWYGFGSRVEWCACFVSWCANECGYIESGIIPRFSLCTDGANWFKENGQWQNRNYEPQAGDIIFFDWEGDGETDHVGIVEKCENGIVYTVEGNSGDQCRQKQYSVGSSLIYGYGVPSY